VNITDKQLKNYADELVNLFEKQNVKWWETPNDEFENKTPLSVWQNDWTKVIRYLHMKNNL
jgi:hypothetical protein